MCREVAPTFLVMALKFANDDKTRLASASRDGSISVFNLTSEPPSLVCILRGHSRAVNGESGAGQLTTVPISA